MDEKLNVENMVEIMLPHYQQTIVFTEKDSENSDVKWRNENFSDEAVSICKSELTFFLESCGFDIIISAYKNSGKFWSDFLILVAHDFWLTRNGHGSGFWDSPEIYGQEESEFLSSKARECGERYAWFNDIDSVVEME